MTTTATYIIKWIQGAKKYHDLDINFVGVISDYYFFNTKTRVCLKKENSLRWMLIVKILCICWLLLLIIAYHPASSISAIFRIRTSSTIFKNYKGSPVPSILLEGALKDEWF